MQKLDAKAFGAVIGKVISKQDLRREECRVMFEEILLNKQTDMQQGAFFAALAAKGETVDEIAGAWEAICKLDTVKTRPFDSSERLVDNCGTGMDTFKTFNISTAASIIAAAAGAKLSRHGARAITSTCGTVDLAEALGVDVECDSQVVVDSIEKAGLGLFNGNSPKIHPQALGRILSQISFGTVLNIAASLANPARPVYGVRGVCSPGMIEDVPPIMREIGYRRALVLNGMVAGTNTSMDEASTLGETLVAELLENGGVKQYRICPEEFGIKKPDPLSLQPAETVEEESKHMVKLLSGSGCPDRAAIAALNAGLILYVSDIVTGIKEGYHAAAEVVNGGRALEKLFDWVTAQNDNPDHGISRLNYLLNE